ncbi:MAG: LptF/LptG family permease [Planctomycetota bacterium]
MTTIDRYLLRQYFRVFLMVFISLLGIFIIADFIGNLAKFIDHSKESDDLLAVLSTYYGARVPWFFDIAGRNIALISAILSVAWLQKDNEMTALMAAGISRWRVAKPLIFACVVIAILGAINREWGVPPFRMQLCRNARDLIKRKPEKITPRYDIETDILFNGESLVAAEQKINMPLFRLQQHWPTMGKTIKATEARYIVASANNPAGYLLDEVQTETDLTQLPPFTINNRPVIITPRDLPNLESDQLLVVSNLSVDQLRRGRQWQQFTSTASLISDMQQGRLASSPDLRVMIHSRFVQPLLDISLIFLGLPFALGDDRRRIVGAAAKSLIVIIAFALIVLTCHALGIQLVMEPALAAWCPLLIVVPAAFIFSEPLRR